MPTFNYYYDHNGFTYSGPDGWARFGPGGSNIQSLAAAPTAATNGNEQSNNGSTNDCPSRNTTKQKKRYYCSYGHGPNNSHKSHQCYRRKRPAGKATRSTKPSQKMLRQEVSSSAQKEFVAAKVAGIKTEDHDDEQSNEDILARYSDAELKKIFENVLARSSDAELKEILEEVKKEMNHRGTRWKMLASMCAATIQWVSGVLFMMVLTFLLGREWHDGGDSSLLHS